MLNNINLPLNNTPHKSTRPAKSQAFSGTAYNNHKPHNAKAVNQHGDSFEVSFGSTPYVQYQPAEIYPPFHLNVAHVINNLIKSVDGMTAYGPNVPASWQVFPQRNSNHQAPAFNRDLSLNGPQTFNKTAQDGCIDSGEKNLAANQLAYDSTYLYPQGSVEQQKTAEARNLLSSIFFGPVTPGMQGQIRPEFDVNMNGKFDSDDAQVLSILDGDIDNLSMIDLNIATTNYVMNKPYQQPFLPPQQ